MAKTFAKQLQTANKKKAKGKNRFGPNTNFRKISNNRKLLKHFFFICPNLHVYNKYTYTYRHIISKGNFSDLPFAIYIILTH